MKPYSGRECEFEPPIGVQKARRDRCFHPEKVVIVSRESGPGLCLNEVNMVEVVAEAGVPQEDGLTLGAGRVYGPVRKYGHQNADPAPWTRDQCQVSEISSLVVGLHEWVYASQTPVPHFPTLLNLAPPLSNVPMKT